MAGLGLEFSPPAVFCHPDLEPASQSPVFHHRFERCAAISRQRRLFLETVGVKFPA
jgi:hypothetical protein